jgi:hypothetical protein
MADLQPRAAPQHDREGAERRAALECGEGLAERAKQDAAIIAQMDAWGALKSLGRVNAQRKPRAV